MKVNESYGLYLFKKETESENSLKEMLQFLKSQRLFKTNQFSYIEAGTSLHPELSLIENIQIELGKISWDELPFYLTPELQGLLTLVADPEIRAHEAQGWEKFLISFIKGTLLPTKNLIIDINEKNLSPFLIQKFKRNILDVTESKTVYLATANTSLWLDCAHSLVGRNGYDFQIEVLASELIKKNWAS